jgi:hypothetical protein
VITAGPELEAAGDQQTAFLCAFVVHLFAQEPPGKTCSGRFFRLPLNRSFTENEKLEK